MNILYLEKRGCDFFEDDKRVRGVSDMQNYRLFLTFVDREGVRVSGDLSRYDRRTEKGKVIVPNAMHADFCYEDRRGCWGYHVNTDGYLYTQADALKLINGVSAVQYDAVEIVDRLPDAAKAFPEEAEALAAAREAQEHAQMARECLESARDNWVWFCRMGDWRAKKLTPDEYKQVCLAALENVRDKYGIVTRGSGFHVPGILAAREVTKHIFEEQEIFDPLKDRDFINAALPICPYHVAQYLDAFTLEQFAIAYAKP